MEKLLCAVMCCHWRNDYAQAQRDTWAVPTKGIDIKFFFGCNQDREPKDDEVFVDCPDDYIGLPAKVQAAIKWAFEQGYDYVFKCDDDTYVVPARLVESDKGDYRGRYQLPSHGYPAGFCSGGPGYWLSRQSMQYLIDAPQKEELQAEDRWVANSLYEHGIIGEDDKRYKVTLLRSDHRYNGMFLEFPRAANNIISCCEFAGPEMYVPHRVWQESQSKIANVLNKIKVK